MAATKKSPTSSPKAKTRQAAPTPNSQIPPAITNTATGNNATKGLPQMQLQDPYDGPLVRAREEWKDPNSWFGVEDSGRLLDIPETFGGTQTLFKWPSFIIILGTLVYLWSIQDNGWFLGHLDHWALFVSVLYMGMSLVNGHVRPPQPAVISQGIHWYLKFFWITFEVAAHLQLLDAVLYWCVGFHQERHEPKTESDDHKVGYDTIMLHGGVLVLVWIDGMVMNRIPVRIKHYFIVLAGDAVYVVWTILHAVAGWDNGKKAPVITAEDAGREVPNQSDAIYISLDWKDETIQTLCLGVGIFTFIAPLLFIFQYLMSLYSCPWTWNGSKSRKYLDMNRNTVHRGASQTQGHFQSMLEPTSHNLNNSKDNHMGDSTRRTNMGDSTRRTNTTAPMGDSTRRQQGTANNDPSPAARYNNHNKRTKERTIGTPRSTTPAPRSTTPLPRSNTPVPRSKTPTPRSTTPAPTSGSNRRTVPPGDNNHNSGISDTSRTTALSGNVSDAKAPNKQNNKAKKKATKKKIPLPGKGKNKNRAASRDSLSIMDIA